MAISIRSTNDEIIRWELEIGIAELEQVSSQGKGNHFSIRSLGNASILLGHPDIAERALLLLQQVPDKAFFAGAISNFKLPEKVPDRFRRLDSLDELEKRYPRFHKGTWVENIRTWSTEESEHILLCLGDRVDKACQAAKSQFQLEQVGCTLAVLGEFESAARVAAKTELEAFRQSNIRFIMMIELFRNQKRNEAHYWLSEFESNRWESLSHDQFALGLAGRIPWGGYPYPDW